MKTETDRAIARFVRRAKPDDPWEVVFLQLAAPSGASISSPPVQSSQAAGTVVARVTSVSRLESIRISPGTSEDVYVSYFSSPGLIFVHLAKNQSVIDKLSDALQAFYDKGTGASNPAYKLTPGGGFDRGQLVAAKFVDKLWYRGEILELRGQKAKVWYIDYGNQDEVDVGDVRVLDSQFSSPPKQVSQSID